MSKKITDQELAEKCLKNSEYFNHLVDRYADKIRRYIARITGNWTESEDIAQDVFFKAYKNIASFNPQMSFSAWIYRIAHNESVNFIKKHYKFKNVEFNDEIKNKLTEDNEALKKIFSQEHVEIVQNGLKKLNQKDKEILELVFFEEKSYIEIADILQMHINSVGPTIKRAKDKLKKIIR